MTRLASLWLVLQAALVTACSTVPEPAPETIRYVNGKWWNGSSFERGERYVRGGVFATAAPAAETIDLADAYVVPPLSDGHVHGFDTTGAVESMEQRWQADGVFTILSLGGPVEGLAEARVALRDSPFDVRLAGAMLTSPGGHPIPYYEGPAMGLNWWRSSAKTRAKIRASRLREGSVYWAIDDTERAAAIWPDYVATRPDFVKIILFGDQGLSRDAAQAVVARSHLADLKVVAHVQTLEDLVLALDLGVDLIAHAPNHDRLAPPIPEPLLTRLAAAGIPVTPTLARELAMERWAPEEARRTLEERAALRVSHAAALQALHSAGVPLVAGADLGNLTALDELAYWQEIAALQDYELLRVATAPTLREWIGLQPHCLETGCPASFVVTSKNPGQDIRAYRSAHLRVHEGKALQD